MFNSEPNNEQAKTNLEHFRAEQLRRDAHDAPLQKEAANNKNKKKQNFIFTYERLCRGESGKVGTGILSFRTRPYYRHLLISDSEKALW